MQRSILKYVLSAAVLFAACDSTTAPVPNIAVEVAVTPTTVSVMVGATSALSAVVTNAFNPAVTWRSANPAVATVNAQGVITGVAPGATLVTAISVADTLVIATASVTVDPPAVVAMTVLGLGAVTERWTSEVAVRGTFAYTTSWSSRAGVSGNLLRTWNVSGDTPVLVDTVRIASAGTTGDVQISDDGTLLVVATEFTGSIAIFNRSNPAAPQLIRQWSHAETAPGVHTVKLGRVSGRHYAFLSINPSQSGARLLIVDITDPANPALVWSERMGQPYVHDVFVRDGFLLTALWHEGLRIYDIGGGGRGGTPSAPLLMGSIPTISGYIHNIWWFHDPSTGAKKYVFLGEENTQGVGFGSNTSRGDVHVIDVSDMSALRQVAQFAVTGAGTHNFSMDEPSGILYAAYYNGGVRALDVRGDLGACAPAQKNSNGFCDLRLMGREAGVALRTGAYIWGVAWQDGFVFASDMRAGLYKLDARELRRSGSSR